MMKVSTFFDRVPGYTNGGNSNLSPLTSKVHPQMIVENCILIFKSYEYSCEEA